MRWRFTRNLSLLSCIKVLLKIYQARLVFYQLQDLCFTIHHVFIFKYLFYSDHFSSFFALSLKKVRKSRSKQFYKNQSESLKQISCSQLINKSILYLLCKLFQMLRVQGLVGNHSHLAWWLPHFKTLIMSVNLVTQSGCCPTFKRR